MFSFELIREKKKKCVWGGGGEKELELVKDRLSELGKGRNGRPTWDTNTRVLCHLQLCL